MKSTIKQYIRKDVAQMESYVPGTSAWDLAKKYKQNIKKIIKLNTNENPYGPSPIAKKAILNTLLQYYPPSDYLNLREKLANYAKVKKENIVVGAGSDEVIDLILRVILQDGDVIINCPPTFGMYEIYNRLNRGNTVNVYRNQDFSLNTEMIINKCLDGNVKAIFLSNPNSPTGTLDSQEDLIKILETGKLVIVDEAYCEFSLQTVVPLLAKYQNLIILRTLSKWAGLAGLRLGYGIMSPYLAEQIFKIKPPYSISVATEQAAIATLGDLTYTKKSIQKIITERDKMFKKLLKIHSIKIYKSYGNFIFVQTKKYDFEKIRKSFEDHKIALRYFPKLNNGIRITIGKPDQNKKVLGVFQIYFSEKKCAFLDRDGTLIFEPQDTFQIDSIEKLKILNGVIKGLKELIKNDFELIMISNQDGLGTSSFPKEDFDAPQNKMLAIFKRNGITFKEIFICPHSYMAKCKCRKPKLGLVRKYLLENKIDKTSSFVCGDRNTDQALAKNIGIKFISMQTNGDFYESLKKGKVL